MLVFIFWNSALYRGERTDASMQMSLLVCPPSCFKSTRSTWFGFMWLISVDSLRKPGRERGVLHPMHPPDSLVAGGWLHCFRFDCWGVCARQLSHWQQFTLPFSPYRQLNCGMFLVQQEQGHFIRSGEILFCSPLPVWDIKQPPNNKFMGRKGMELFHLPIFSSHTIKGWTFQP